MLDHQCRRAQGIQDVLDRGKESGFVLLEIAVVGERKALEHRGQGDQRADRPAGPPPQELGDVRVLLLGHEARPGGDLVGEPHEAELRARPEDDVFAEPAQMDGCSDACECEVEGKVAVGDRVHAVLGQDLEAKLPGDHAPVERQRRPGESARAERHLARRVVGMPKTLDVAEQRLRVGQ